MFNKKHILVVDDDERLGKLLKSFLYNKGYLVDSSLNTIDARIKLENIIYDMIILDVMLPEENGLTFAAALRKKNTIPILMLSAMGDPEDKIKGLKIGVEDYLAKPFEPEELLLRINNILKSKLNINRDKHTIELGDCSINTQRNLLLYSNKSIKLTNNEIKILIHLYKNLTISVEREELAKIISVSSRTIDVIIKRLRTKINKVPNYQSLLLTSRGIGYKMDLEV